MKCQNGVFLFSCQTWVVTGGYQEIVADHHLQEISMNPPPWFWNYPQKYESPGLWKKAYKRILNKI